MLLHMTTGEPVTLPEGVTLWCLERVVTDLAELYCATCGIIGTNSSVYSARMAMGNLYLKLECDFCGSMGAATFDETQL